MPTTGLVEIIDALGEIPKDLRRELRPAIRAAAQPVLAEARSRASWSDRIPPATKISARFGRRNPGVAIRVSATRAPHARPLENKGRHGTFRHPVFGNREVWVAQRARPFLAPAVQAHADQITQAIGEAIFTVARAHGFR